VNRSLTAGANPFFCPDIYFPYGASLYFHTLNLLQAAAAVPIVRMAGLVAAYNLVVLAAFVLTGYATFLLAHDVLTRSRLGDSANALAIQCAAFIAGVAFTFSSYRFAHLHGHLDLLSTEWLALCVLFVLRVFRERRWIDRLACGICLAAAGATNYYYLLFLLLFIGFAAAASLFTSETRPRLEGLATSVVIGLAILSPILVPMLSMGQAAGRTVNPVADIAAYSADVVAFFVPSPVHPLWGARIARLYRSLFGTRAGYEHITFLGYVPLVLGAMGVRQFAEARRFWLPATLVFAVLACGPVLRIGGRPIAFTSATMPYGLLAWLPFGDTPRVPVRFVAIALLTLAVIAAYGAVWLFRGRSRGAILAATGGITVLLLFENAAAPVKLMPASAPNFFSSLQRASLRGGLLEVPIPDDPNLYAFRMFYQTVHALPIYDGYVARPVRHLPYDAVPGFSQLKHLSFDVDDIVTYDQTTLALVARAAFSTYGVTRIVLEKRLMTAETFVRSREVVDRLLGGAMSAYEDADVTAFVVPPQRDAVPLAIWLDTGWYQLERRLAASADLPRLQKWRWMGASANVAITAPRSMDVILKIRAASFARPRRVRVLTNRKEIATLTIGTEVNDRSTPSFRVDSGVTFIELQSVDIPESPRNDPRALTVAVHALGVSPD
jgi:hypothetical protein